MAYSHIFFYGPQFPWSKLDEFGEPQNKRRGGLMFNSQIPEEEKGTYDDKSVHHVCIIGAQHAFPRHLISCSIIWKW